MNLGTVPQEQNSYISRHKVPRYGKMSYTMCLGVITSYSGVCTNT